MSILNRRQMLTSTLGTAAALSLGSVLPAADSKSDRWKLITFTKFLQPLSYDEMADAVAEIGFDGIEAPIRLGGHIEPENVADELPKFVEALKKRGLTIDILTSSINSVDSPNAEETLKVAKALGIPRYRMNYYKYDLKKPVTWQLREAGAKLKDLVAMNEAIGIQGVYQNHSGSQYVGARSGISIIWFVSTIRRTWPWPSISVMPAWKETRRGRSNGTSFNRTSARSTSKTSPATAASPRGARLPKANYQTSSSSC